MSRVGTAFRSFFASLGNAETAARVSAAIDTGTTASPTVSRDEPPAKVEPPKRPARSDALTLLAALQRDGRLIDFLLEPIDGYTDEQVGAATRDLHRGCGQTLKRLLTIEPVIDAEEGSRIAVGEHPSGSVRVVGSQVDSGELLHPGWKVSKLSLPDWTGSDEEAAILMPAEVQGQ